MIRSAIALLALYIAAPVTAGALEPEPFKAHYEVQFSGLGGDLVSVLTAGGDGKYVFENRTTARGFARFMRPRDVVDRSEFRIEDQRIVPLSFESSDGTRRNKQGNEIVFDWGGGSAHSDYSGDQRMFDLDQALLDRQLMQLAMMDDLAAGKTSASYTVIDRHDIKTYDVEVLGAERITVPAGEFDAVKVKRQRNGSSRATILWCVPELNYLPVLTQQHKDDKVIATLALTAVE